MYAGAIGAHFVMYFFIKHRCGRSKFGETANETIYCGIISVGVQSRSTKTKGPLSSKLHLIISVHPYNPVTKIKCIVDHLVAIAHIVCFKQ